ncbi:MAG: 1,4-dihydroxy-2-naphthoyl-CoA synthase [Propionibacteriaceae bacterium]|jgi:naphthoate synthase|nr:1,4-dihydroxy-2-naphthoyl-CoA synthase [Propionibacteriaceae bacterium]
MNPFQADLWEPVDGFAFEDITYHRARAVPAVRVAFNRPEVRNAFRPQTVDELYRALDHARMTPDVGCVLLTGNGPSPKDGGWAFCSGGDQRIRGRAGYEYREEPEGDAAAGPAEDWAGEAASGSSIPTTLPSERGAGPSATSTSAAEPPDAASGRTPTSRRTQDASLGRLHILEVQRLIRFMPKVVIALVNGWAAGGGHSLHVVCDLTLASAEEARFKQTDADVGSFDAGFGSAYLARQVGQKFAREIFFLGQTYDAAAAHRMGMVNAVVPHAELETVGLEWAAKICGKSPTAQRMLKFAFNAIDDGLIGQQVFAGETTRLAYMTDEAVEGRDAFLAKRPPDWSSFPYYY